MKFYHIAVNTFKEAIRNKILYSVILFAALVIFASLAFGSVSIGDQIAVVKDFGLFAISIGGSIATILAGVSLLEKEIKSKTIYNILSKPVSKSSFIIGKLIGLMMTSLTLALFMGLILTIVVYGFSQEFNPNIFQGIFLVMLEVSVVAAITIFFSVICITPIVAGLLAFGVYISCRCIKYVKDIVSSLDTGFEGVDGIVSIADSILFDANVFNVNAVLVYNESVNASYLFGAFSYAFLYIIALAILSIAIFMTKEVGASI